MQEQSQPCGVTSGTVCFCSTITDAQQLRTDRCQVHGGRSFSLPLYFFFLPPLTPHHLWYGKHAITSKVARKKAMWKAEMTRDKNGQRAHEGTDVGTASRTHTHAWNVTSRAVNMDATRLKDLKGDNVIRRLFYSAEPVQHDVHSMALPYLTSSVLSPSH